MIGRAPAYRPISERSMSRENSSWGRWTRGRQSRRTVLRGTATAGAAAAMLLAGCQLSGSNKKSKSPAAGTPKSGGTLNLMSVNNPVTLDPQRSTSQLTMGLVTAVMSRLFRYKVGADPQVSIDHEIENDLAQSAESSDGVTWIVKLRPGVNFQNVAPVFGRSLGAEDIKVTFQRAADPRNQSRGSLGMIDPAQIQTPSPDTIIFKLKYPYAPFTSTLASPIYSWIFPREVIAGTYDPTKQIIGSGPFLFDSYTPDVAVTFKKNPNWFEQGQPHVDSLKVSIITSPAQAEAQFRAGNLDVLTSVQQNDLQAMTQGNPKARMITATNGGNNDYYFQLGSASAFQDIRIRQAISMAIDRDAISKAIYNGQSDVSFSVRLFLGKWALHFNQLDPSVQQYYKFNLDEAKKLFTEAGGSGLNVRIVYITGYGGSAEQKPVTEAIYNMLQALPWKISLGSIDFSKDFIAGGKGYDYGNLPPDMMLSGGTSIYSEADEYLYNYYDSKSGRNVENLNDPALDAMIDKARTILSTADRQKAYLDVQQYIAGKMYPVQGLPSGNNYIFVQPWVQNYQYSFEDGNAGAALAGLWLTK